MKLLTRQGFEEIGKNLEIRSKVGDQTTRGTIVIDAQPATEIHVGEKDALFFQSRLYFVHSQAKSTEYREIGDLGTDVKV